MRVCKLSTAIPLILLAGCAGRPGKQTGLTSHWVERSKPGVMMYVDPFDPGKLIEGAGDTTQHFVAYKVGFCDSALSLDPKVQLAASEYYQYRMSTDWRILKGSDSLSPVFYHPVTTLAKGLHEGVLVFELPEEARPEKLVYNDANGLWDTQVINLQETK